jgi:hypothetical protein
MNFSMFDFSEELAADNEHSPGGTSEKWNSPLALVVAERTSLVST